MGRDDVSNPIGLCSVRQAVQFQQHHAGNAQPLTNDKFAKITIFRDQDAAFRLGHCDHMIV